MKRFCLAVLPSLLLSSFCFHVSAEPARIQTPWQAEVVSGEDAVPVLWSCRSTSVEKGRGKDLISCNDALDPSAVTVGRNARTPGNNLLLTPSYRTRERFLASATTGFTLDRGADHAHSGRLVKLMGNWGSAQPVPAPGIDWWESSHQTLFTDADGNNWVMGHWFEDQAGVRYFLSESSELDWPFHSILGKHDAALALAKMLLNPYVLAAEKWGTEEERLRASRSPDEFDWGDLDRRGVIGSIYPYANPYSRTLEFFRLVGLGRDGRYWYFPTNQKDNRYWEYLGTQLPSARETLTSVKAWRAWDEDAKIGDVYVFPNPASKETEYFRLEQLDDNGRYGAFPTQRTNDRHWTYLGTDLPTASR